MPFALRKNDHKDYDAGFERNVCVMCTHEIRLRCIKKLLKLFV